MTISTTPDATDLPNVQLIPSVEERIHLLTLRVTELEKSLAFAQAEYHRKVFAKRFMKNIKNQCTHVIVRGKHRNIYNRCGNGIYPLSGPSQLCYAHFNKMNEIDTKLPTTKKKIIV